MVAVALLPVGCCGACHLGGGQGVSRGGVPRVGRRWEGKHKFNHRLVISLCC